MCNLDGLKDFIEANKSSLEYMKQYNARWLAKLNLNKELPQMVQVG